MPDLDAAIDRKVTMARVVDTVTAAFKQLPNHEDLIAKFLEDQGIKGGHSAHDCPMRNYLKRALDEARVANAQVSVSQMRVIVWGSPRSDPFAPRDWELVWGAQCPCGCDTEASRYTMPATVGRFVDNHDAYRYPAIARYDSVSPTVIVDDQLASA